MFSNATSVLLYTFLTLILFLVLKNFWKKRRLYYYGSKISGPFSWPIIGSAHLFFSGPKVFYKTLVHFVETQPEIFKFWLGQHLLVVTSRPEDVDCVVNKFFEKGPFFEFGKQLLGDGLLRAPAHIWKDRRKMFNPTFRTKILNTFIGTFGRHANKLVVELEECCGKQSCDLLFKLLRCSLDTACETLTDVDSTLLEGKDNYLRNMIRVEDIVSVRTLSFWYHVDIFWKMSPLSREMDKGCEELFSFIKQVIELKKLNRSQNNRDKDNAIKEKLFINHLLNLSETDRKIDDRVVEEEIQNILLTSTETSTLGVGMVLIILGILPKIQGKVSEELKTIFGTDDRQPTLEDINKLEYLERVIKETFRLFPVVPMFIRSADHDIKFDCYTIPAGSIILIPIFQLNKKPEFWNEPQKFDPDRFLPENNSNRHRCTFIPFSYGPRNCLGLKYGMMSMKVVLSTVLRNYTIKPTVYKKLDDIEMIFGIVNKPSLGFKVKLEKKCNFEMSLAAINETKGQQFPHTQAKNSVKMICENVLVWLFSTLIAFLLLNAWHKRRLLYYASKINGPFSWPIIGSAHYFIGGQKVFYKKITQLLETQPEIFKIWLGGQLVVVTSRPEDVEVIVNKFFEKGPIVEYSKKFLGNSLLRAPAHIWKDRRKMLNPTFNQKILNTFMGTFATHAHKLVKELEEHCGKDYDVFSNLIRCTLNLAIENLADVDSDLIQGQDNYLQNVKRLEDLLAIRIFTFWFHADFFWKMSPLSREMHKATEETFAFVKQIIKTKKMNVKQDNNSPTKGKLFINHLIKVSKTDAKIDDLAIEEEIQNILIASSETTALTAGLVLTILGIFPEIQFKVSNELGAVFGHDGRAPSLEDINKMEYLECVIKETLRLFPVLPIILRFLDQDIKLGAYTIPAGCSIAIPICHLNKKADFWENPEKFDPDRFLRMNSSERHRCTFIPFSYGPRNCIGLKYGMMSLKVLLSTILRNYTIKPSVYEKLEDIEMVFCVLSKPSLGFKVKLEKKM
nr:PREDICTED: uncharacterized protein LOC103313316 [Tribolium castaneum]|eukprot:XP_015836192.1 PREDICTED: uncharacterized protein LOC103313316 [Tribolium castaneum]